MVKEHIETERKYDLAPDVELPDLIDGPVTAQGPPRTTVLRATYYDTADLALATARITLRRRIGGTDEGWHVKLPIGTDSRRELHHPLGRSTRVPAVVARLVTSVTYGTPLVPVVRLTTRRVAYDLADEAGTVLAEVADDTVSAQRLRPTATRSAWREVEVELVDGVTDTLDAVERRLASVGLERAMSASKLARALGAAAPEPTRSGAGLKRTSAGAALHAYLDEHRDVLAAADLAVRADDAGVHDVRVSARRLRTALTVYRPLLDESRARHLQDELRWLGQELSDERDSEVIHKLATAAIAAGQTHTGTAAYVEHVLATTARPARTRAERAMASRRYASLLADLDHVISAPPWSDRAAKRASTVMPKRVRKALRRVERRVEAVSTASGADRFEALHDVRKAIKRLRYALEVAEPPVGRRARRLRKRAKRAQTGFGDFLDATHLRDWLLGLGQEPDAGPAAFDAGVLYAQQRALVEESERAALRDVHTLVRSKAASAFRG